MYVIRYRNSNGDLSNWKIRVKWLCAHFTVSARVWVSTGPKLLVEKKIRATKVEEPFLCRPCSDNKPRFVYSPALRGRIRFINYSVVGTGGTSESDVTVVPRERKKRLCFHRLGLFPHTESVPSPILLADSVQFVSQIYHLAINDRISRLLPSVLQSSFDGCRMTGAPAFWYVCIPGASNSSRHLWESTRQPCPGVQTLQLSSNKRRWFSLSSAVV